MDNMTSISLWTTLALLTRIEVMWEAVSEVDLCTTQWEGWILNHLSKLYFPMQSSGYWNKSDPFKLHNCRTATKLYEKFNKSNSFMTDPNVVFEKAKKRIFIIDCELGDDNEDHLNTIGSHDVLLYHRYYMDGSALQETKIINNIKFELRFVSAAYEKYDIRPGTINKSWDGFVYSRHGGHVHKGWWFYSRFSKISTQYSKDELDFKSQKKVTLLSLIHI